MAISTQSDVGEKKFPVLPVAVALGLAVAYVVFLS